MLELLGEYELTVDTKGRLLLPAQLRKQFPDGQGDQFVINRGFENCLTIFPMETWKKHKAKIAELNDYDANMRMFKRIFLNGASIVEVDNADRILIPKTLQEFAKIKKDAILVTLDDKMELWDKDTYNEYLNNNSDKYGSLADSILGNKQNDPFKNGLHG